MQIFPRLKDLQATQATVKRGIIALTSEDLAEKLWGRLRRAGLCGSQRELQQMQQRLANKDPALLKDIQLVSEESCKGMEQQLSTEEVDWILRRVLARQPLRRFAIYACFVQHWIGQLFGMLATVVPTPLVHCVCVAAIELNICLLWNRTRGGQARIGCRSTVECRIIDQRKLWLLATSRRPHD